MKELRIRKLHCDSCSEDLINEIKKITNSNLIKYDEKNNKIIFPEDVDENLVKEILYANKVLNINEINEKHHEHSHHGHHHDHNHDINVNDSSVKNILFVFLLNIFFAISEFILGIILNSTAIFTDSVHDLGDAVSIGMALILEKKSKNHSDKVHTFGYRRFSLLGALVTGGILVIGSIFAISRAIPRLINPVVVNHVGMTWVAIIAVIINLVSAYILKGRTSKNEQMLTLHMLEDMLGWIGIFIISIVLKFTDWYILDPIFSIVIAVYILYEALPKTFSTLKIFMEAVPAEVDIDELSKKIYEIDGVNGLSHLHFWSMDGEINNFNVTIFTDQKSLEKQGQIKNEIRDLLTDLNVYCSTIEIDYDPDKYFTGIRREEF